MAYTPPSIPASGTTFAQMAGLGLSGHLEKVIALLKAGTNAPTAAPTLAASGSGNSLPAGTYYVQITETNGIGETTASPTSAGQAVTSGQQLTITFPALQAGNTARNVFVGTSASGPFTQAATGVAAATANITAPPPSNSYAVNPPTTNTTGLTATNPTTGVTTNTTLSLIRAAEFGNLQDVWRHLATIYGNFNAGNPVAFNAAIQKVRESHVVFAAVAQLCYEIGTLIDANPGHFTTTTTPIGAQTTVRQWP